MFFQAFQKDEKIEIRTVATDGHRLALSFLDSELTKPFGIIIPRKSVNEIRRIIEGAKKIKIAVSRAKIKIIAEKSTIISKLIDGEFPDYDKVLPKNNTHLALVNRKIFFDCVDRVSTVASDKHRSVKVMKILWPLKSLMLITRARELKPDLTRVIYSILSLKSIKKS